MSEAIGLDLGGTQIKAVLVNGTGEVLRRAVRATDDSAGRWAETMRELAEELGVDLPVGISAPGLAARDGRSIAHMPGRLAGLEGLQWEAFLGTPVRVLNDGHASLLGEVWAGAARGCRDVIMLTLGTGVGGAAMVDGRLLRGHLGRAGHLGHTCLDANGAAGIVGVPGSLEDCIGNHNILQRTGGRFPTTHAMAAAFEGGDADAGEWWGRSVRALGCGIASFINCFDPEVVIVGGGIAQAGDTLFRPLAAVLAEVEWRPCGSGVRVLPAALGEWAGAVGAAGEALREVRQMRDDL